jgi:hypothetical protein
VALLLWVGIAAGCLAIMMLHHLSGGGWGIVVRRVLEAAARTLPYLALLFVPLLLGLPALYRWARPELVAADELLQHKAAYLNRPFFGLRIGLYFATWWWFARLLGRWSRRQDQTGEAGLAKRMRLASAPGLALYCLTATFAAIDWIMSLDPHWFSSIFGIHFVAGQALSALAFMVVVAASLSRRPPLDRWLQPGHFHDHGNLMLAFVMLWAYFGISQYLIIWSGNLPEEIPYYLERLHGGWQWVALALVVLHFAIPFALLLSRDLKRRPRQLARVALLLLAVRWLDLFWQVAPTFHHRFALHWLDLAAPLAVGGFWLALFLSFLRRQPLLPGHDPQLRELVVHG